MEFYRVEYLMENWRIANEKEQKQRSEQDSEDKAKWSPSAMQRSQDAMMKKYMGQNNLGGGNMPSMPNMSLPNVSMPKL